MKRFNCLFIALLLTGMMGFYACQKEPGPGGKASIHGHVEHEATGTKYAGVDVHIYYGETSHPTRAADDETQTASDGSFEFTELNKGDYFLASHVTDTTISPDEMEGTAAVTITSKKEEVEAHLAVE